MLLISREVGEKGERLAAQLGKLILWRQLVRDTTANDKVLNLLFDWDRGGGERKQLVQHLQTLQFNQLAKT